MAVPEALVVATARMVAARTAPGAIPAGVAALARMARPGGLILKGATAASLLALGAFAAVAFLNPEDEKPDDPLPDAPAERIAESVFKSIRSYERGSIEVEFEIEEIDSSSRLELFSALVPLPPVRIGDVANLPPPSALLPIGPDRIEDVAQLPPPKKPGKSPVYHKFPGKARYISDGTRWRAEYDSFSASFGPNPDGKFPPNRWSAGYDGTIHYRADAGPALVDLGNHEPAARREAPASLFWDRGDEGPLFKGTEDAEVKIEQRTVDGFRCYVVRSGADGKFDTAREILISPRQSYLPLSVVVTKGGRVEHSARLLDLERRDDGRWFPRRVVVEERSNPPGVDESYLTERRETRVVRYDPAPEFRPGDFDQPIPFNTDVIDRRTGLVHRTDPWWPELSKYLAERFDWPRADVSSLDKFRSPEPALEGREAPPLAASRWLRGEPFDRESRRGKVTLVVFPRPGDGEAIPALRRLIKAYGPSGFAAVEVLPEYVGEAWASRFLDECDPSHAVVLDRKKENELGATFAAFGLDFDDLPAAYLVDAEGKVRTFAEGGLSPSVVEALHKAGATDARPLAPAEGLGIGRRYFQVQAAWNGWAKAAPATARIVGTVVDADGRPVAGATVRARLFAMILAEWKRTLVLRGPDRPIVATGPDGRFAVEGLCKGNYDLEIVAPGRPTSHVLTLVKSDLGAAEVAIRLGRSDRVAGVVRDRFGKGIPGATVELYGRHVKGPNDTSTYTLELKRTAEAGADGRFQLEGLAEGWYSLRASADGFQPETRDEVEVGTEGVEVTLGPAGRPPGVDRRAPLR